MKLLWILPLLTLTQGLEHGRIARDLKDDSQQPDSVLSSTLPEEAEGSDDFRTCAAPCVSCGENQGLSGAALMFPEEGDTSYAVLWPKKPMNLTEFTLCFRASTLLSGYRKVILFSYCLGGGDEVNVWREYDGQLSLYLCSSSEGAKFSLPSLGTFPTHICVTWDSPSGVTSFWINGKKALSQIYRKRYVLTPGGFVILGQDQDDICGGGFDAKESFVGEMSDLHLWNRVLSSCVINDIYEKKKPAHGNIIDWNSVRYSLHGNVLKIC